MYSLPSYTTKPRHFGSELSPVAARRRYRQSPRAERLHSCHARKRNHTVRVGWDRDEGEDGRRLAFDPTVALPGERQRHMPRLERQEAFRVPKTWDVSDTDVIVNDAELYRLGILYDDDESEHIRESSFCLNAIKHKEPVYSIHRAKRAKKSHGHRLPLKEENFHLSVELLSTYLGDDTDIARFFPLMGDEELVQFHHDNFGDTKRQQISPTLRNVSAEPLSIVYELAESPIPTESDFPDLVSDKDEERYEELMEDKPCNDDWALVSDNDSDAGQSSREIDWLDTGSDVVTNSHEEMVDPVSGTWVFLAMDDS